jgi:SAM-dependent methyltransferase
MISTLDAVAASWDAEYRNGRYRHDPPVPFVVDIMNAVAEVGAPTRPGLYIGCGNGRNYLPLLAAGVDLIGLDLSSVAIEQLSERRPDLSDRLVCGDLSVLPPDQRYPIVVGLQVFQHGTIAESHAHVRDAIDLVEPDGLFCMRVNAVGSDLAHPHDIIEQTVDGGFTVLYRGGPKEGLAVHFFSAAELTALMPMGFSPVLPLRRHTSEKDEGGRWEQWEGIWRRTR